MDRQAALDALPEPYALALHLAAAGADDATIATAARVPMDAVVALIEVGEGKLAILLDTADPTDPVDRA